jgi:hypothetical protein
MHGRAMPPRPALGKPWRYLREQLFRPISE